jgi:hypothetical protein
MEGLPFQVYGSMTAEALDVLLRCLKSDDLDVVIQAVVVDISEWSPGAHLRLADH